MRNENFTKQSFRAELERILHFWSTRMVDPDHGGFFGQIDHESSIVPAAPKGAVLNARILWTFSSAYPVTGEKYHLELARRSYEFIRDHFIDRKCGGVYWMLDHEGKPLETKKQMYALAFTIYALSAYYELTKEKEPLMLALELFDLIEGRSFDAHLNGYFEAYTREWNLLEDMRLSDKDANEKKTMNTHLHILEAYTKLLDVSGEEQVRQQLYNILDLFVEKFYDRNGHFHLFFDEEWRSKSDVISYGHDIEAIWLIDEGARMLGDVELEREAARIAIEVADATLSFIDVDGGLFYEGSAQQVSIKEKHWWPQAEGMVGMYYAYDVSGRTDFLNASKKLWDYIQKEIIDPHGEWIWGRNPDGSRMKGDIAGIWKCPYHNSRAMMEMMKRW